MGSCPFRITFLGLSGILCIWWYSGCHLGGGGFTRPSSPHGLLCPPQGPRGRVRPAEGGRKARYGWLVVSLSGRQSLHMHVHMGVWWLPAGRVRPLGVLGAPLWALVPPQGPRGRVRPAVGSRRALFGWLVVSLSCIRPMQLENRIRASSGQERFLGSYGDSYQALWGIIVSCCCCCCSGDLLKD